MAFPLFFVLHGVNEQFGLISFTTVGALLLLYFSVAISVAILSKLVMKTYERAAVYTFTLLCIYFFFGAVKDTIKDTFLQGMMGSYKMLLPLTALLILVVGALIKKIRSPLTRANQFIRVLLAICVILEAGIFIYNGATGRARQKDPGDIDHALIRNVTIPDTAQRPTIVWIVMDEYSGNTGLKKKWNFNNPVNEMLRTKGFFVADSAYSPYNYTHYSLASTLDMTYMRELRNKSVITYRDIVRGNIALRETNVLKLLKGAGYDIHNYTIYNVDGHPTRAREYFIGADFKLIDNQTLSGRIRQDIGWNFRNVFTGNRGEADSVQLAQGIMAEAGYRRDLINKNIAAVRQAASNKRPAFMMFHYMLTHEPFIYKTEDSLDLSAGFGMYPDRYVPSINRANRALSELIDSVQSIYAGKNLVIILQGDHGYKFDEADPLFEQESCSILYAVYCSDQKYTGWRNPFNSVNGFSVLFNKYFHTNLPIQENLSINLYYR